MSKLTVQTTAGIAHVAIDNAPINLLTLDLINELNAYILSLKDDSDTKAVVFKSSDSAFFLAHLDITLINGTAGGQAGSIEFSHLISNIKAMKQLSIAVVDGVARGGGNEFVMACDLAFGTENAAFAQPEIFINIPTGGQGGGTVCSPYGQKQSTASLVNRGRLQRRASRGIKHNYSVCS